MADGSVSLRLVTCLLLMLTCSKTFSGDCPFSACMNHWPSFSQLLLGQGVCCISLHQESLGMPNAAKLAVLGRTDSCRVTMWQVSCELMKCTVVTPILIKECASVTRNLGNSAPRFILWKGRVRHRHICRERGNIFGIPPCVPNTGKAACKFP